MSFVSVGEVSKDSFLPQSSKHDQTFRGFHVQGISLFSA